MECYSGERCRFTRINRRDPQKTEIIPEKTEVVPEKTEVVQEKTEVVPEKTEVIPEKTEVVQEKTEVVQEKTEVVLGKFNTFVHQFLAQCWAETPPHICAGRCTGSERRARCSWGIRQRWSIKPDKTGIGFLALICGINEGCNLSIMRSDD